MKKNLYETLKRYEGQPLKIYTDDGRVYKGIELEACEESVRIIDRCGRLILIELCHIDAVEEPQLELHRCRKYWGDGDGDSFDGGDYDGGKDD